MPGPRLVVVFFIYGLAFFAMGLAIALEARRSSELHLARSLKYLAAYGFLHAGNEWIDMWLLLPWPLAPAGAATLRVIRLALLATSTVLLALFGTTLIGQLAPRLRRLRWVPLALLVFWLANWLVGPHLNPLATQQWTPTASSCLRCHADGIPVSGPTTGWVPSMTVGDIWARYVIYLPAAVFAAAALFLQGKRFLAGGYQRIARDCWWMAAAFLASGIVAGLIVPPARFAPASWLNYDRFLSEVGLPPQVFRAALAVVIAIFGVRILRVFDMQYARQLAEAQEGRLRAQVEALEATRRAASSAEESSRQLETKVKERTEELFEQVRRLAILEERDRLAREMHDSLGQVLGFVNLKTQVAEDLIDRGRTSDAREELNQMRSAVQEAYGEVRQAILSLRSTAEAQGMLASLREYIERFAEQSGLDTRLEARDDLRLPPAAETQVIRIVQEALTNVRKHAQATRVLVRFAPDGSGTGVTITDNGVGFDPSAVQTDRGMRFGMLTMRERAESIGGRLTISSAVGQGTTIQLWVPGGRRDGTHPRTDR